jgi:hypothetical protein
MHGQRRPFVSTNNVAAAIFTLVLIVTSVFGILTAVVVAIIIVAITVIATSKNPKLFTSPWIRTIAEEVERSKVVLSRGGGGIIVVSGCPRHGQHRAPLQGAPRQV